MADPTQPSGRLIPHPQSADYAALAEMSYRRSLDANSSHIDVIDGVESVNFLDSPELQAAAGKWREGTDVQTYVREQYGLTIDPVDRGDGLTHVYTENGFSGYITHRDNGTADKSDDQFIITYRGTDITDNAAGEMTSGIAAAGRPLLGAAALGAVSIDGARNLHPSPEEFRTRIADATGEPFADFTVTRDDQGRVQERLVDAGDIYTNGLLGQGTYQETQYDDASALFDLVNDVLVTEGQAVVTNGQSLGGGLAALVGVENNVESHTFGMAPFQRQFEIIGQRNAVSDLLTDPDISGQFGALAEQYAAGTSPERHAIERAVSDDFSDLHTGTGGHEGRHNSLRIDAFNRKYGTDIDRSTIHQFRDISTQNASQYEGNKTELYASTVSGEFTTNSGNGSLMGAGVELGSVQIIPTDQLRTYDVGVNQVGTRIGDIRNVEADGGRMYPLTGQVATIGTRVLGEGLSTHSPALHDLVTASQSSASGGFDSLMADNPNLRYSILHRPGLAGAVISGKVGPDDDPSASQARGATNETLYRALSNSLRSDGALYEDTHQFFETLGAQGRGAEGADIENVSTPSLNGAITQFALQDLRDSTTGLRPGQTLMGDIQNLGGIDGPDGLVGFNVEGLEPTDDRNRLTGPGSAPIAGMRGIHGYTDLQTVFYDEIRAQMNVPSDQGFFERDAVATARVADEITGSSMGFRNFRLTEGKLTVPQGELEFGQVFVESGAITGVDASLGGLADPSGRDTLGTAIFLGDGENTIFSSNRLDLVSLGGGNDEYISGVRGGAIVSGGEGIDSYGLRAGTGPVFATVTENYTRVAQLGDRGQTRIDPQRTTDTVVGVERVSLSDNNDLIAIESVSDGALLDGGGGRNFVDYRQLDSDFKLDIRDGVLPTGEAYTSRLSDGESSYYFINIADEDIARRSVPDAELLASSKQVALPDALQKLQTDFPLAQNAIAHMSEAGTLSLADAHIGKLLSQSGTPNIFRDLNAAGVETLDVPQHDLMNPISRVRAMLAAGNTALQEADLPMPESQYLSNQDMTGISNAAYHTAAAVGGPEGDAILRGTMTANGPNALPSTSVEEHDHGAYA